MKRLVVILLLLMCGATADAQTNDQMVRIRGGIVKPFTKSNSTTTLIKDFLIDAYPVTNAEYQEFVEKQTEWRRSKVKRIFADESYLRYWDGDLGFNAEISNSPVVNVSWFAAKAYCECQQKRLPTADEWDYLSLASETKADGSNDKNFNQYILDWYSRPNPDKLPSVKSSFKNYYGVYGIHGLVWEWVLDFNSAMLTGESRTNTSSDGDLFCGSGAGDARDRRDYVAFMRYAFRSSLKANYTVPNLGFRCVKDLKP